MCATCITETQVADNRMFKRQVTKVTTFIHCSEFKMKTASNDILSLTNFTEISQLCSIVTGYLLLFLVNPVTPMRVRSR